MNMKFIAVMGLILLSFQAKASEFDNCVHKLLTVNCIFFGEEKYPSFIQDESAAICLVGNDIIPLEKQKMKDAINIQIKLRKLDKESYSSKMSSVNNCITSPANFNSCKLYILVALKKSNNFENCGNK